MYIFQFASFPKNKFGGVWKINYLEEKRGKRGKVKGKRGDEWEEKIFLGEKYHNFPTLNSSMRDVREPWGKIVSEMVEGQIYTPL